MKIPFLDIAAQIRPLRTEIDAAISKVIDSTAFAGGSFVEEFESQFATYCDGPFALGVGSGTEAIWLALLAMGVGHGDEVITVPSTFLATAEAITYTGAKPVFVDIHPQTYTMDPALLSQAITPKTKAIIPVHLLGHPADLQPILHIARQHGIFVVEDACQAHGAEYHGKKTGFLADAGCFSFYPGKNLGAFGEAGAVLTNNPDLHEKIRVLRDHGQIKKYHHTMVGWNCRMDGIQAAVLNVKLPHLDHATQLRRQHATTYNQLFAGLENIITPFQAPWVKHVFHIYAIQVERRDALIQFLAHQGIGTGIHYPIPVHLQEAYRHLDYSQGSFPVSEKTSRQFISLPLYPELTVEQIHTVSQAVKNFLHQSPHA